MARSADDLDGPSDQPYSLPHTDDSHAFLPLPGTRGIEPDAVIRHDEFDASLSGSRQGHRDVRRVRVFHDVAQAFLQQTKNGRHGARRNIHRNVPFGKFDRESRLPTEFLDEITYRTDERDVPQVTGKQIV